MERLTVVTIAKALSITPRAVHLRSNNEAWPYTETSVKGGRQRVYDPADLPAKVQDALRDHMLRTGSPSAETRPQLRGETAEATTDLAIAAGNVDAGDLKGWQREIMLARLALLREAERIAAAGGLFNAFTTLSRAASDGTLPPALMRAASAANAKKGEGRTLSVTSLRRWHAAFEAAGRKPLALAPDRSPAEKTLPPAWLPDFLEFYALPTKPTVAGAYQEALDKRPGLALPPLRTVQHHIKKLPALARNRGRMGPRALRQMKAFVRRDVSELWPTAVYVTDGHTHHAAVAHPLTGKPFRPEITATIDVVTRRITGWSVALSEATWGTIDALRHAFTTCGVPDIWYVDRGKGFNNDVIDDTLTGLLARFGVTKERSLPYRSQARGVIERFHRTWIEASRFSPTYQGWDMDPEARKRVDDQIKLEIAESGRSDILQGWDDFIVWCGEQVAKYNDRPHAALPKIVDAATGRRRHMSPDEVWRQWEAKGWSADREDGDDIELMFRPQERRKVNRCEIQLFTNRYFADCLEDFHELEVLVSYDIHDASKVWVFAPDGQFITEATYFGNSVSFFPVSKVEQDHERRVNERAKRVGKRMAAVEEERQKPVLEIVARRETPIVIEPESSRPTATLEVVASPNEPPVTAAKSADDRPERFKSDFEMAAWLWHHRDRMTAHDAGWLVDRLTDSPAFTIRLSMEGIDAAALKGAAKAFIAKQEVKNS
ncbi:hypothetical protein HDIA_2236 [Hartmannibacter diazotrophicus]|uniref:Integrase catalytic domain-containing protein n=1 Tax=Hartmannibacter diazotrophicus TaxID=1482074 RepID=A0A2C9D643_9HYPH|nr:Mu transposase C-terminal domain-containing protein [Hartmannibacter diazotrophicus]SON55777.1 hypothetical protein HDIA_2236 [Hartmannibacter diazotrophicus]